MATAIEARIAEALYRKLSLLTLTPVMAVAYPNRSFTPPSAGYLRVTHLPATPTRMGLSLKNQFMGVLQVDVFWPTNKGAIAPLERAGEIAAFFKVGTRIDDENLTIKIDEPPAVEAPLQEADWFQVPVSIAYYAFISNP